MTNSIHISTLISKTVTHSIIKTMSNTPQKPYINHLRPQPSSPSPSFHPKTITKLVPQQHNTSNPHTLSKSKNQPPTKSTNQPRTKPTHHVHRLGKKSTTSNARTSCSSPSPPASTQCAEARPAHRPNQR